MDYKYRIVEAPYKPQKQGITLSHSSISVMGKCPREYYLQYILKKRVPDESVYSAFGSMIHLIAENYKGDGQEEIKQLFDCFQKDEKLRKKYWDKLDTEYKKKTLVALKNLYFWLTKRLPMISDYASEVQLDAHDYDEVDGTPIHITGKLDGYYTFREEFFITDFKTGKKPKDHSEQLGLYYYLLYLIDKEMIDQTVRGEIINVSLNSNPSYDDGVVEYYELEEYDIAHAERRVKNAVAKLKKNGIKKEDIDNWPKKPQVLCDWCKFKKAGVCDGKKD